MTKFIDNVTTISASWLNQVDTAVGGIIPAKAYGATGDGITDDTAAIATLESKVLGSVVTLGGGTYKVTTIPKGNSYVTGRWVVPKSTTISGATDLYSYYAPAVADAGDADTMGATAYARSGLSTVLATYTRPDNHQGVAVDDVGGYTYLLYVDTTTTPETSYIAQYSKTGGAALATSKVSTQLGHQGLTSEQNQSSQLHLWGPVRYDAVNYPQGHRQVMRFQFAGAAADLSGVQIYTLFGAEYAYTGNAVMPSISYDQRYLVALGRKSSRDFWVRVFLLKDLVDGGPGDYSNKWIYEWNVDRELLADDGGDSSLGIVSSSTPVQAIACDSGSVYLVAGNSNLTTNRMHVYSLQGVHQLSNDRMSVGLTDAKAVVGGTEFEPEGLVFTRPSTMQPPVLAISIQYGVHGSLTTSLYALGYKAVPTLASGRWTPTAVSVTNITAVTPFSCHYSRNGNEFTFAGRINLDPIATGYCEVRVSLPFVSDLTSLTDAVGTLTMIGVSGTTTTVDSGAIEGDVVNDTLVLKWICTDTANRAFYFSGMGEVK